MALLNQKSKAPTFYEGWYGNCESECEDFALITGTGSSASHIHNNIQAVFTISDNAEGTLVYNGLATIPQVIAISPVKSLICGVAYRIVMKPGTGSLDIPHFTFGNIGADKSKRVADNCDANPTPTPSPVIDCCDGISESVMFVNGMVQETDGVISGLAASVINGELCYPAQSGDGFGTFNCSFNFTTGTISVTIFVRSDVIQTDDNNLFRFKSSSGECLEGRLTSTTENNDFNPVQ
jgi:hypothetical protein